MCDRVLRDRDDVDDLAAALGAELDGAGLEREQRVVATATDTRTRVEVGATLADDDLAGLHDLAAEALHAEALGVRVTTVASRARSLFVCHVSCSSAVLLDAGDLDARELLTVALALLVPGLVLELLDHDLRAAEVVQDLSRDRDLRERLGVGGDLVAVDEEDGGQLDRA